MWKMPEVLILFILDVLCSRCYSVSDSGFHSHLHFIRTILVYSTLFIFLNTCYNCFTFDHSMYCNVYIGVSAEVATMIYFIQVKYQIG